MAEKRPYEYDAWGRQGQQRRGQTGSGRTPGGQDPWDEVCRSMNELGAAVATEVGRGLKEGWDQVQKSLNEAQAAGKQGQQPPQPVRPSATGAPPLQGAADACWCKPCNCPGGPGSRPAG